MLRIVVDKGECERALQGLAAFADFRKQFLSELPRHVLGWVRQRIRTRLIAETSGPDGERWPPWSDGYEGGKKLLFGDGTLANSLKMAFTSGHGQLGTSSVYANIHQHGGLAGPKDRRVYIPARPWFGLGKRDEPAIEHLIQAWVDKAWRAG